MEDGLFLEQRLADLPRGDALEAFLGAIHIAIRLEEEGIQYYSLNANRLCNPRGRAADLAAARFGHRVSGSGRSGRRT